MWAGKNARADIERTLTEHGVLVPAKISKCPQI